MNRVDYLQARLKQLRLEKLLPVGFSNWLVRLELGERPAGSSPIQPVHRRGDADHLVQLMIVEICSRL